MIPDSQGHPVEQIQYYHRAVGCQIVSSPVKPMLAVEWLQPGEGEDTAALRLLTRLPELYGSPFFDILLLDSLYAQAPVLKLAAQVGWDLVVSLKQEARELYQNAIVLFTHRPADQCCTTRKEGKDYAVRLWDTDGLPFTQDHPQPVLAALPPARRAVAGSGREAGGGTGTAGPRRALAGSPRGPGSRLAGPATRRSCTRSASRCGPGAACAMRR